MEAVFTYSSDLPRNFTHASLAVKDIVLRIVLKLAPQLVFANASIPNEELYACGTAVARENVALDVNCRSD